MTDQAPFARMLEIDAELKRLGFDEPETRAALMAERRELVAAVKAEYGDAAKEAAKQWVDQKASSGKPPQDAEAIEGQARAAFINAFDIAGGGSI